MAKKFNLAEYVKAEPASDMDHPEITLIPWDHIRANLDNFYTVDDVDELRNSIQMHGLLDPIVVTPEEEGWYLLISGHRRHKAWGLLREEDPARYAEIPAIVRTFESKAMAELALIMANSSARRLTSPEIARQAERVTRLLYDLKEQGYEFNGRMRDQVAQACQVSSTKLARLKMIQEHLLLDFRKLWDTNRLPEATAYELAQGSDLFQAMILRVAPDATAQGVARVRKIFEAGNDYSCADLTGPGCSKCTHRDAFLRHDLEDYFTCEGKTCCLKCERAKREWNPCSRACSKAKAKWKTAKDERKAKEDAERDAKQNALHTRIRESAIRLVKAADASGADDDTVIPTRYGRPTVKRLREIAAGGNPGYCYDNFLLPENGLDAASTARALGCSADYVCGLTEDLQPAPYRWTAPVHTDPALVDAELTVSAVTDDPDDEDEVFIRFDWREGNFAPIQDGRYLCTVDLGTGYAEQTCDWRDGQWLCYGRTLDDMFTVVAWWPLPPKMTYRPEAGLEEDGDG